MRWIEKTSFFVWIWITFAHLVRETIHAQEQWLFSWGMIRPFFNWRRLKKCAPFFSQRLRPWFFDQRRPEAHNALQSSIAKKWALCIHTLGLDRGYNPRSENPDQAASMAHDQISFSYYISTLANSYVYVGIILRKLKTTSHDGMLKVTKERCFVHTTLLSDTMATIDNHIHHFCDTWFHCQLCKLCEKDLLYLQIAAWQLFSISFILRLSTLFTNHDADLYHTTTTWRASLWQVYLRLHSRWYVDQSFP
jgi:hypothetical protein